MPRAQQVVSAVAKGEPSTALILVMQYLQHSRLQENRNWPSHLRVQVAEEAVREGALINALRVEPDLGTPARGGLPGTVAQ
ncbi:Acyl-CoA dehydrogenase protein, partial [Pseudomonas savastanoi]